jgi:hypothetical protein
MSDVDVEDLIARLSGGLAPADRSAFRKAAESALASSPDCSGEGATYRAITKLWRSYFRPPRDTGDNGWYETRPQPTSLAEEDPPQPSRTRRRARSLRVWRGESCWSSRPDRL